MLTILSLLELVGFILLQLANLPHTLSTIANHLPLKFGFALVQNSFGLPQPKFSCTLSLSPALSYKASISLGALTTLLSGLYELCFQANQ